MDIDAELAKLMDRHDFLCREAPHCQICGSNQVQLMSKNMPAEWKCRICKRWFKYEPAHARPASD